MSNSGLAALLSFFLPGAGQLYNGHFWRAIFWFVITPGLWLGSGGLLGWICHVLSAWTAYNKAEARAATLLADAREDADD